MEKLNFKSLILALTLLTIGTGQMWAAWYVVGDNMPYGWSNVTANKMSTSGSTETAYLSLAAGLNYDFKLYGGSWDGGSTRKANDSGASVSLDTDYQTWDNNSAGDGKMRFSPTVTGVYKFVLNTSTNKLRISYEKPSAAAPSAVVSGTNVMFYIQSYSGIELSLTQNSTSTMQNATSIGDAYAYINITKSNCSSYYYITNNRGGWVGNANNGIKSATGGELFVKGGTGNTSAATASTSTSVTGDVLSISTTTSATSGVLSGSLYIQYYIDGSFVGVTYSAATASYGDIPAGGATARASTYNVSGLSNGSHTLKTVLTDGIIYYVADQDNFNVAHTYSIVLDDDGAYDGNGSATVKYGDKALTVSSHASRAGWNLAGYWNSSADQVTDASGNLIANVTDYTNSSGEWIYEDDVTLYAHWTQSPQVTLEANKTTINIGETVRLTATGSNATGITKYDYYVGGVKTHTISSSSTSVYWDYTPSTVGNKSVYVVMTHSGGTETSSTVGITINTPSVSALSAAGSVTELWLGVDASDALRFTATSSNVNSAASYSWSISDASSGTFSSVSSAYNTAVWDYTPTSTGSKTITVTLSVGGQNYTRTYSLTVYERWNIYVQNNCSWGAVALYQYGNGTNADWPGVTGASTYCEPYTAKWYKVTLDSYYPYFILGNNVSGSGQEQLPGGNSVATNKGTYAANTYWDFNYTGTTDGVKYYALRSISPSVPTVSITSYEVISCTQIKLTGTISNYGSDGSSAASHMKEVGFYCGETKHSTTHTDGSTFTKVITGLTAGTEYSFKAYAVNVKGEGKSSVQDVTTRTGGTYTIKVRTAVGAANPKVYAWTAADANDGVLEKNANYGSGAAMTVSITGTVYKWWSYDVDKTYNNYIIYETGDGNKTDDITAPQAATCYWYNSGNAQASRCGTMDCPHTTPQLYIETTAGNKDYDYHEMTNTSGTLSKSLTLTAKSTYEFKIFYNGEYFGKESAKATRGTNNVDDLSASDEHYVQVETDAAGSYTFAFTTGGKDLTVTYPDAHKITYGIGAINGSSTAIGATSTPSFTSGDYVLDATAVTFTKGTTKNGYHWEGWYPKTDGTGDAWSTADNSWTSAASTRSADIKVYACYSYNNYTITYHLDGGSNHGSNPANFTVATPTITLQDPSKTGYNFVDWYTNEGKTTPGKTIPVGTYTNKEFWASWTAKDYTITLKSNGGSGDDQELTATYDAKAPDSDGAGNYRFDDITNPSRTGYTFGGWWTSSDAGTTLVTQVITEYKYYDWDATDYVYNSGCWKYDGNVTLYAKWTANNYTVNLSASGETGYGSAGSKSSVTATFGSAMPAMGTAPTPAPGYKFMGYFTGHNGSGTQYYNANGTSATNWNIASTTTLYAYFQKTVISSLDHPAAVAKGDVVTVDVNPVLNQDGAQNYMDICWSFLYDNDNPVESGWAVAPYTEGGTKPRQVRFTLTGISSGYYKIKAVLKSNGSSSFDPCSTGTELSTLKSDLRIAGNSKVTILYEDASGNTLAASGSVEVARGDEVEVTAPDIIGYAFSTWSLGDVLHTEDALTTNPITISADYDGYLTAKYTKKQMIYFNNTLEWEDVYVYFYNDGSGNEYWADGYGTGANKEQEFGGNKPYYQQEHGHMTQIEGTNIWYFDFKAAAWYSTTRTKVAFATVDQSIDKKGASNDEAYFHDASVVYRTDFDVANLPMFVPINSVVNDYTTNTGSKYYRGYWMNYPESTGYTLKIFDNTSIGASEVKERKFEFPANKAMPMSVTVDLEGGNKTYGFKIYRQDDVWFRNGGTMTNGHSGDEGQAEWVFGTEGGTNCGLTTTSAGNYTFKVWVNSDGNHQVGVHYPESSGDFRVMYTDDVRITKHSGNEGASWLLSSVIPGGTESDTISYFVRAEGSKNPKYKIQKCSITWDPEHPGAEEYKTVSWADQGTAINVPDSITENGVYNFIFTKDNSNNLVLQKIELYEGNFYIRVDGAGSSNWDNFRASDHLMPYSDYSFKQSENPYSHYFTQWYKVEKVGGDVKVKNIKFVVANDYSVCVSDTIVKDGVADAYVDQYGYITRSANIRFMYNYKTNEATRRYVDGAQESGSEFLMIIPGNSKIYAAAEGGDPLTQLTFSDKGNWVYEAEVYALPTATYKLKSKFGANATGDASVDWDRKGEITQYFKGGESTTETLIGGNSESTTRVKIRLLYDFKTNRVVAAYQPSSGTISESLEIHADIMFVREHQGDIEQITFAGGTSISAIENIYCCLKFNKYTLNNLNKEAPHGLLPSLLSRYERDIFYVSFPYDVRLSDVIGFGTYGQHWIIEYYDGAARAKNGFWSDSESYWKFVTPAMKDTFTLRAGTGYIVALDLDEMWYINDTYHADIWNNTTEVELLFPGDVSSISEQEVEFTMPAHTCTINRGTAAGNRTKKDSHWNVLGVPTFKNITGAASGEPDEGVGSGAIVFDNKAWIKDSLNLKFIYDGNLSDNTLTAKAVKGFEFKAMHAYVVQYCGKVTFTTSATPAPAAIAARRINAEKPQDVDFRLELTKNGVMEDQTFISMSNDDNVSADFAFGEDLSKEFNKNRSNIYTFIGTEWVAGNTLPMSEQTTIVPVGVKTTAAGEYTFSMPDGTDGIGVTLIDNVANTQTNLALGDYTVSLPAGTIDNRFSLSISPIQQAPTSLEAIERQAAGEGARKVMVDGILYILRDGKVYDAQGRRAQ